MRSRPDDAAPATQYRRALVVVAAGSGTRLGFGMPKAAVPLGGRTILDRALAAITADLHLDLIVLVLPADPAARRRLGAVATFAADHAATEAIVVGGGATRTESVIAGSTAVAEHAERNTWEPDSLQILIHDAARPLTPTTVFRRVFHALESGAEAVVPALEVSDTIKRVDAAGVVAQTLPRSELRSVQTPQGFTLALLQRAADYARQHPQQTESLTDDAMIAEHLGVSVATVNGDPRALKITTEADLITAEALLGSTDSSALAGATTTAQAAQAPRVGIGQDVHAFAPPAEPTQLWLAGLHWPGEQGLAGHSDGDVVAHACCDALFSAAGVGDLGVHFGTDRPELAGASGVTMLREAANIVGAAGFSIGSIAVQFIGSRPKFGPRREQAQRVLSEAAGAPVAVSATTSDGLGFAGRGEGLLATATAVLIPAG